MNSQYQGVIEVVTNLANAADDKDKQIAFQKQQIATLSAVAKVTLTNIQAQTPESLWYEARSPGAPKTGPHGTITIVPGIPATADFRPVRLAGNQSDNVYNLRRLYPSLTDPQKAFLDTCKKFSISCDVLLDPLQSVQAFELDFQTRKNDGTVINIGPQLIPSGAGWQLRGFDYINKVWVPLGAKANPQPGKSINIEVDATCDGKTVQFVQVIVDGVTTPVTFSHPVSMDKPGGPYLNAAYQFDATGDAKPYKAVVGNLTVSFS